jgi:hypothetical protein
VLEKTKASAFFQTPLSAYLIKQGVDTAVVCGVSTSGCVRASAVDAFSHGFITIVVDDCCFDRSHFAHCANLFDLQAKYAAVLSLEELRDILTPVAAERTAGARLSPVAFAKSIEQPEPFPGRTSGLERSDKQMRTAGTRGLC